MVFVVEHKRDAVALSIDHDYIANVDILLGIIFNAVVALVFCTVSKFFIETLLKLVLRACVELLFWKIIVFRSINDIHFCESVKNLVLPIIIFLCQQLQSIGQHIVGNNVRKAIPVDPLLAHVVLLAELVDATQCRFLNSESSDKEICRTIFEHESISAAPNRTVVEDVIHYDLRGEFILVLK